MAGAVENAGSIDAPPCWRPDAAAPVMVAALCRREWLVEERRGFVVLDDWRAQPRSAVRKARCRP
jgi:hypothetical protein